MPGILENIVYEQETHKKHYVLAGTDVPGFEQQEQRLRGRLKENYTVYKMSLKSSVMEQIRRHKEETKELPTAQKDSLDRSMKSVTEL